MVSLASLLSLAGWEAAPHLCPNPCQCAPGEMKLPCWLLQSKTEHLDLCHILHPPRVGPRPGFSLLVPPNQQDIPAPKPAWKTPSDQQTSTLTFYLKQLLQFYYAASQDHPGEGRHVRTAVKRNRRFLPALFLLIISL
jgi:hypothetical protein